MHRALLVGLAAVSMMTLAAPPARAQRSNIRRIEATSADALRQWDGFVTRAQRSGDLRLLRTSRDPALPDRVVERYQQFYGGVRVWGAEIVRDSDRGLAVSIFGVISENLTLSVEPAFDLDAAGQQLLALGGSNAKRLRDAELVVLPRDSGEPRLAYTGVVASDDGVFRLFVDARTRGELLRFSAIEEQSAVGTGTGVLGDTKKVSAKAASGAYMADDQLRPPHLTTYDMRNDLGNAIAVVEFGTPLFASDVATDTDNVWSDPAVVDAHAHIGWTYDYYYRRFGRRGLDDGDRPLVAIANAVSQQGALSLPSSLLDFALNAFWCDDCGPGAVGVMFFGNGIPSQYYLVSTGDNVTYFAGGLDVVAHELTHGVTTATSNLVYYGEPGALNEAFSDMMGTSVEFYYQTPGDGLGRADYLIGEDISRQRASYGHDGFRSMADPGLFGDPDHYSKRYTGSSDNGGVHRNSGIANQAFYLAIEGGTNRTSGLSVTGVGGGNREQIERVFYRAFTLLMPATGTFATARATTIQAARDLFGDGSAAVRAMTDAWTAVGVQ